MEHRTPSLVAIVTLVLSLFLAPYPSQAQSVAKTSRIGILSPTLADPNPALDAFRQGLRDLGYVEGQSIALEYRFAEGRFERLPELAADLVRLKVDVILVQGGQATAAAQHATGTIPIVFPGVPDPVGQGSSPAWRSRGETSRG
jgi:putative tryptophan/tyrosine transport system substrate-binding protein